MWKAWKKFLEELTTQRQVKRLTAEGLDMKALEGFAKDNGKFIRVTLPDRTVIEFWKQEEVDTSGGFW